MLIAFIYLMILAWRMVLHVLYLVVISVVMDLHLGRHTTTLFRLLARKGTLLLFMGRYGMVVAKIVLIRIELLYSVFSAVLL